MVTLWSKHPAEVLDYQIDFSARLDGDTITGVPTVTAGASIVVDRVSTESNVVTFWLSGGVSPATTSVACTVLTTGGRTFEHQVILQIAG